MRGDFKALEAEAQPGVPLTYFDSGATSQKPTCVLEAVTEYYLSSANVHRGEYQLATHATELFEGARSSIARLIGATSEKQVVFTSGATDAINLVAYSWGTANIGPGDEIVATVMEHHSNIVPWQILAKRTGAVVKYARITEEGELDVDHLKSLLSPRTKLVTFAHISNVLGCITPVREVVSAAREVGARVLLDACQSVPHMRIDVKELGVDWLVASGHKMCGPTGVGFLWGSEEILNQMTPWKGGGEMINEVSLEGSTFAEVPARFEAGTPPIAQAVGLGAACEYLMRLGMDRIEAYEQELARYLWDSLSAIEGLKLYGPPPREGHGRAALVCFDDTTEDVYSHDIAVIMDEDGFAIRAGYHCAQPLHKEVLMTEFGSARASLSFYNTREEIDRFVDALRENLEMLRSGEGCVFDPNDPDACLCSTSRMRS